VLRVAVTGITASGKSTIATELVNDLCELGTPTERLTVDGYHNPRAVRYRLGRDSADGYYRDAYDYDQLKKCALIPLGPGGDLTYSPSVFDLEADTPITVERRVVRCGSVVIFDASFLLRAEIRDLFDYRVLVHTPFEEAARRGVVRDAVALGGSEEAERLYRNRYHEAQRIYFREARPFLHADAVLVNEYLDAPALFIRRPDRTPDCRLGPV
jgi:uridine kinase